MIRRSFATVLAPPAYLGGTVLFLDTRRSLVLPLTSDAH